MIDIEKINRIKKTTGYINIMKKIWNIVFIAGGGVIIIFYNQYNNQLSLITIIVPMVMGVIFYLIRQKYVGKFEYYVKDNVIQYINFSKNEVFHIHYSDVIRISVNRDIMDIYLLDEVIGSVYSKKYKKRIRMDYEVDKIVEEMKKYDGWVKKIEEVS